MATTPKTVLPTEDTLREHPSAVVFISFGVAGGLQDKAMDCEWFEDPDAAKEFLNDLNTWATEDVEKQGDSAYAHVLIPDTSSLDIDPDTVFTVRPSRMSKANVEQYERLVAAAKDTPYEFWVVPSAKPTSAKNKARDISALKEGLAEVEELTPKSVGRTKKNTVKIEDAPEPASTEAVKAAIKNRQKVGVDELS